VRRSKSIEDAAADPVPKGRLDRRFFRALAALLGKDAVGLSPTAIGRLKDGCVGEQDAWQKRAICRQNATSTLGRMASTCKPGSKTRTAVVEPVQSPGHDAEVALLRTMVDQLQETIADLRADRDHWRECAQRLFFLKTLRLIPTRPAGAARGNPSPQALE
jgi:hypothetical protein